MTYSLESIEESKPSTTFSRASSSNLYELLNTKNAETTLSLFIIT